MSQPSKEHVLQVLALIFPILAAVIGCTAWITQNEAQTAASVQQLVKENHELVQVIQNQQTTISQLQTEFAVKKEHDKAFSDMVVARLDSISAKVGISSSRWQSWRY